MPGHSQTNRAPFKDAPSAATVLCGPLDPPLVLDEQV
eukprot:CAMPEP_0175400150 /NCGR_PEP_ID=MMETSP0095-20121207/36356_1 /TAXON_ID=311494 /ORGANISM="Alexandrium monilatum, Strain CCMP3105" /LENGTH=36 /DNA_ID= /DNA_START= /DNA_END= /DNA_ORIENTATION=